MAERPTAPAPGDGPVIERVRSLVAPIAADLDLDVYDVEQRGGTLRVTLDTPAGSTGGVTLDTLALATRLLSRELDHTDPVPGRYTLEVSSPGLERSLRTPAHFRREVGKPVTVRLTGVGTDQRRLDGVLVAADDTTITVRTGDAEAPDPDERDSDERVVAYDQIDRARTVFEWGPAPKPGGPKMQKPKSGSKRSPQERSATKHKENHAS